MSPSSQVRCRLRQFAAAAALQFVAVSWCSVGCFRSQIWKVVVSIISSQQIVVFTPCLRSYLHSSPSPISDLEADHGLIFFKSCLHCLKISFFTNHVFWLFSASRSLFFVLFCFVCKTQHPTRLNQYIIRLGRVGLCNKKAQNRPGPTPCYILRVGPYFSLNPTQPDPWWAIDIW